MSGENKNWVSKGVSDGVASAGDFVGGYVDSAGQTVSGTGKGVGDSITSMVGGAGGTVSDYGNAVKDWTKAEGPRTQTASNPVGTSQNSQAAKKKVAGTAPTSKTGGGAGSTPKKQTAGNPLGLSKQ